jgi:hypothetical protein
MTTAPPELLALMQRYNQLGRLLPQPDDLDITDPHARAEAKVIIDEMARVRVQIDAFLLPAQDT